MRSHRVHDILRPLRPGMAPHPAVAWDARSMRAIETMLAHGVREIVVLRGRTAVGSVRLDDALRQVGLRRIPGGETVPTAQRSL